MRILLIALCHITTAKASVNYTECLVDFKDSCIYLESEQQSFHDAESQCVHNGGHLVEVNDVNKRDILHMHAVAEGVRGHDDRVRVWIGGNDIAKEGIFTWIGSGDPVPHIGWLDGEPNNYNNNENCMEIRFLGRFNDYDCATLFPFYCDVPNPVARPIDCESSDIFRCTPDDAKCLSPAVICDGISQCSNDNDEKFCASSNTSSRSFECNGVFLNHEVRCNGNNDCGDKSDEKHCSPCEEESFHCSDGHLISTKLRCDGNADCWDNSDENGCVDCGSVELKYECRKGVCIKYQFVCDGIYDCENGTDEKYCGCPKSDFHCGNGQCLPKVKQCDGHNDCPDGSDELVFTCFITTQKLIKLFGSIGTVIVIIAIAFTIVCIKRMVISNRNKARKTSRKRRPRSPATGQGAKRNILGEQDSRPSRSVTAGEAATRNIHGEPGSNKETTFAATGTSRASLSCNDIDPIRGADPEAYDRYASLSCDDMDTNCGEPAYDRYDDLQGVDIHITMPSADVSDDSYDDMPLSENMSGAFGENSGSKHVGRENRQGVAPYVKSGTNEPCYLELLPIASE